MDGGFILHRRDVVCRISLREILLLCRWHLRLIRSGHAILRRLRLGDCAVHCRAHAFAPCVPFLSRILFCGDFLFLPLDFALFGQGFGIAIIIRPAAILILIVKAAVAHDHADGMIHIFSAGGRHIARRVPVKMIKAPRAIIPLVIIPPGQPVPGHLRQHRLKIRRPRHGILILSNAPVEPFQMGEEIARLMLAPGGNMHAAVEHRHIHPLKSARGQLPLCPRPRMDQRRIPQRGKIGIAPPRAIDRLAAHPDMAGRPAHLAATGQHIQKADTHGQVKHAAVGINIILRGAVRPACDQHRVHPRRHFGGIAAIRHLAAAKGRKVTLPGGIGDALLPQLPPPLRREFMARATPAGRGHPRLSRISASSTLPPPPRRAPQPARQPILHRRPGIVRVRRFVPKALPRHTIRNIPRHGETIIISGIVGNVSHHSSPHETKGELTELGRWGDVGKWFFWG